MGYNFVKISSRHQINEFHDLPFRIYRSYPNWRPPLRSMVEDVFNPKKNAFFTHGECERFLVLEKGVAVARFAVMNDREKDPLYDPPMGGMGFIEMTDDEQLTAEIIEFASEWHRKRGYRSMRGPINFGENDNYWGLLVENYESPNVFGMHYHPPYYRRNLEKTGAVKLDDQFSYERDLYAPFSDKMTRITERISHRDNIEFRELDMKNIYRDADFVRQIYNRAWRNQDIMEREQEFTELTRPVVRKMVGDLKPVLLPGTSFLVFVNGQPASFIVTIPDMSELLVKTGGKLGIWQLPKFWRFKKSLSRIRVLVFGTDPKYRRLGIEAMVFVKGIISTRESNPSLTHLEGAWVSEKNWLMQRSLEALGCRHHKTHRTYRWEF